MSAKKTFKHLGKQLRIMREWKEISLRAHARFFGISPATLSRIERGYGCDLEKLVLIHEKTGWSYAGLLGEGK